MEQISYKLALLMLDAMDCVALTDDTGRYIYKNKGWYARRMACGQDPDAVYPWQILKHTKVPEVLKYRRRILGHIMDSNGTMICTNYYPIEHESRFFGVLIWTFFTGQDSAASFAHQLTHLTLELNAAKETVRNLARASYSISNIIGESAPVAEMKAEIADIARTNSNVLIEGETGVGKELVAHAIHDLSPRRKERFVRTNCAAMPDSLIESELFGYVPGAFTGAQRGGKPGKFELASKGSLFLDEINSLPLAFQPKLLRVIQERELERIGGTEPIAINTRFITATNCDLAEQVAAGNFREDLYYRLNVVRIRVPPLRERASDIPLLARSFVTKLNYQLGMEISYIDDAAIERLMAYDWPGNIRELQNVIESTMNRTHGDTIEAKHIDAYFQSTHSSWKAERLAPPRNPGSGLRKLQADSERDLLQHTLSDCGGNRLQAAEQLGIARSTFYRKLKKYGL